MTDASTFKESEWTNTVKKELVGCETLVELGCMFGNILQRFAHIPVRHGVDIYEPYLDHWEDAGATKEIADAREWAARQEAGSWDAILMIDLIEHMPKDDGTRLIADAERIARKVIIIDTPDGYIEQEPHEKVHTLSITRPDYPAMLNPHEEHICGWTEDELTRFGFGIRRWVSAPSRHYAKPIHHLFAVWRPIVAEKNL